MTTLADYRAHVARIAALPGSATDEECDPVVVAEHNAIDPASNPDVRDAIPDGEWPAWSEAMQQERAEVIALMRRRDQHQADAIAARLITDGPEGVAVPDRLCYAVLAAVLRAHRALMRSTPRAVTIGDLLARVRARSAITGGDRHTDEEIRAMWEDAMADGIAAIREREAGR